MEQSEEATKDELDSLPQTIKLNLLNLMKNLKLIPFQQLVINLHEEDLFNNLNKTIKIQSEVDMYPQITLKKVKEDEDLLQLINKQSPLKK